MSSVRKRGKKWSARWYRPNKTLAEKGGFPTRESAMQFAKRMEVDIHQKQYIDPIRTNAELDGQDIATGGGMLYISNLKREIIAMIPLYVLIRNNNDGKFVFTQFEDQIWQNCYVEFTNMAGLFSDTKGLMFRIYYDTV